MRRTVKAEAAKLLGAGIGPSSAQENARQKKDSLPKSVRIARKSTVAQNGQRERCEGVVCSRLREYSGETVQCEMLVGAADAASLPTVSF